MCGSPARRVPRIPGCRKLRHLIFPDVPFKIHAGGCDHFGPGFGFSHALPDKFAGRRKVSAEQALRNLVEVLARFAVGSNVFFVAFADAFEHINRQVMAAVFMMIFHIFCGYDNS
jgi:hypothetical protein